LLCVDVSDDLKVYRDEIHEYEELSIVEEGKEGCSSYRALGCDFGRDSRLGAHSELVNDECNKENSKDNLEHDNAGR